jgi:hypothetical protein
MFRRLRYLLIATLTLFSSIPIVAQIVMPDNVCVGEKKDYWVDSIVGSGSIYTWKIENAIQQNGIVDLFSITWDTPGNYLLEVQETSANNCQGELKSGWIFVHPYPDVPTITLTQPTCVTSTGIITITAPLGLGITYSIGGSYQLSGIFSALTGLYTVTAMTSNGCISSATNVTINAQPQPPVIITEPVNQAVCIGNPVSFSVVAMGSGLLYQWRRGITNLINGGNISGATSDTLTIDPVNFSDAAGSYNVIVTGTCLPVE